MPVLRVVGTGRARCLRCGRPLGPGPANPTDPDPVGPPTAEIDRRLAARSPELLALAKTASHTIRERNLTGHRARVGLCLDVSGSMWGFFAAGRAQRLADRLLALATRLAQGDIDIFFFHSGAARVAVMGPEGIKFLHPDVKRAKVRIWGYLDPNLDRRSLVDVDVGRVGLDNAEACSLLVKALDPCLCVEPCPGHGLDWSTPSPRSDLNAVVRKRNSVRGRCTCGPCACGTRFARAIEVVRHHYFPAEKARRERAVPRAQVTVRGPLRRPPSELPAYVMFVTDGGDFTMAETVEQLTLAARQPIFWQFLGVGGADAPKVTGEDGLAPKQYRDMPALDTFPSPIQTDETGIGCFDFLERLDSMTGRDIDNSSLFRIGDADAVDDVLFDLMTARYPAWIDAAVACGLVAGARR